MTSVTNIGKCPHSGSEKAITFYESKASPSTREGVKTECYESVLACDECGYYEDSKWELHDDGKWYTYETTLRPHKVDPDEDMESDDAGE